MSPRRTLGESSVATLPLRAPHAGGLPTASLTSHQHLLDRVQTAYQALAAAHREAVALNQPAVAAPLTRAMAQLIDGDLAARTVVRDLRTELERRASAGGADDAERVTA